MALTLPGRIGGDVIGPRRRAAHPVGGARRVREQRLAERGERALELAAQRRQVVDHQGELSHRKSHTRVNPRPSAKLATRCRTVRAVVLCSWFGVTDVMVVQRPLLYEIQ